MAALDLLYRIDGMQFSTLSPEMRSFLAAVAEYLRIQAKDESERSYNELALTCGCKSVIDPKMSGAGVYICSQHMAEIEARREGYVPNFVDIDRGEGHLSSVKRAVQELGVKEARF